LLIVLLIGIAVGAVAVPVYYSGLPARWAVDSAESIFFGGSAEAGNVANPYGLRVMEYSGKYAIAWNSTMANDLDSFLADPEFRNAVESGERLVVYRSGDRAVLLARNFTMKGALTLSREKAVADEVSSVSPRGMYVLAEDAVLGMSWYSLAASSWLYVILGAALLYVLYVLFYALRSPRTEKEEEEEQLLK